MQRRALCLFLVVFASVCRPVGAQNEPAREVATTILLGDPIPAADRIHELPRDVQQRAAEYRDRERIFRSALVPPRGGADMEQALFEMRVRIERAVFCLFPRKDIGRIAASYASDADVSPDWEGTSTVPEREAAFVDDLLAHLPQPWLAPYLNLTSAHLKLCALQLDGGRSSAAETTKDVRAQLTRARDGGHALIRVAAEYLLDNPRCLRP